MTAEFTDFSTAVPARVGDRVRAAVPRRGVRERAMPDLVAFLSRFSGVVPPATLAGLPWNDRRRPDGAVGLYGRGVTELVAVPIPPSQAREVRRRLATAPGIADTPRVWP